MRSLSLLLLLSALTFLHCKKDEAGPADAFIGSYIGTYNSSTAGAGLSLDEVEADVTKRSADEVKIEITPIAGIQAEITAIATSETQLRIDRQQVLGTEVEGDGELYDDGNKLKVTLNAADGSKTTFEGVKQ